MRRLSCGNRRRAGFTLAELIVAVTITSIILVGICGIYVSSNLEWQRQQGASDALMATSQACSRIADYASQGMDAYLYSRTATNDVIAINLPYDTAYNLYVPEWNNGRLGCSSGKWIAFYLSDKTGSFNATGDILWAGTVNIANPITITPDTAWSLNANAKGKITPISSISFSLNESGAQSKITITVSSTYRIGKTYSTIKQVRTVTLRNS